MPQNKQQNTLFKTAQAEPFLRWAGGKNQLLNQYAKFFPKPDSYNRYIEPFVGGGAVFFFMQSLGRKPAVISDLNADLVNTYKVIQSDVEALMQSLDYLQSNHSKDMYYVRRDEYNSKKFDSISRAAYFIYLNKTNFNGLHRVNSQGKFNVPIGRHTNLSIYSRDKLLLVSDTLKGVKIINSNYKEIAAKCKKGDFIYLDPPYYPLNDNFTSYVKDSFLKKEHEELASIYRKLHNKGCLLMLSNSNLPFIKGLYSDNLFKIIPIKAKRYINCNGENRGDVEEIIVINYET